MVDRAWSLVIICSLVEAFTDQLVGACICRVLISVQLKILLENFLRMANMAVLESSHHTCNSFITALPLGSAAYSCKEVCQ